MPTKLERTIPAPPEAVFAVLSDLDQAKEWMPAIQSIQPVTTTPMAKGSTWVETRQSPRGLFVSTIQVTDYEPGKAFAIAANAKQAALQFRFDLAAEGTSTKVTATSDGHLKGFLRVFSGKLRKQMAEADRDLLERLERQVLKAKAPAAEAEPSSAAPANGAKKGKAKAAPKAAAKAAPKAAAKKAPAKKPAKKAA